MVYFTMVLHDYDMLLNIVEQVGDVENTIYNATIYFMVSDLD